MSQRARIASVNASLKELQNGQSAKATMEYSNIGREPAPVDMVLRIRKWTKADWSNSTAAKALSADSLSCMGVGNVAGASVAFPSIGFGSGYQSLIDSNSDQIPSEFRFLIDDDITKGEAIITVDACYVYKTLAEVRHTTACYFYWASHTPSTSNLNICGIGNNFD